MIISITHDGVIIELGGTELEKLGNGERGKKKGIGVSQFSHTGHVSNRLVGRISIDMENRDGDRERE